MLLLALVFWWGRVSGAAGELQRAIDGVVDRHAPHLDAAWARSAGGSFSRGIGWYAVIGLRWVMVVLLIVWKRWRHLAAFAGSVAVVAITTRAFPTAGHVGTGAPGHPEFAAAGIAVTLVALVYGFVPAGRWRALANALAAVLCIALAALWILTRRDTASEVAVGFGIGFAVPFLGFKLFAPETVFPVVYHRGRTAHLDVSGRRGDAIRTGLRDQLGLRATAIEPFGLGASGGSTPLRITLADGRHLFGKLYAANHMRADRWYKLGRTVLYGALEDERSFNSVRRMVEYEDYMLRYLRDHDVPTAEPFGFVEITPEREYLLVTGFIEDGVDFLSASLDDEVIASAIDAVRALWDAGVAHRDIKPANVLVQGGRVSLIDVFFCQVRPSAWRQSVDLANTMLMLALTTDSERVYRAALRRFTPEDVAEAFAATRGVTVPSQLRTLVMDDERSLAKEFAGLAPPRRRIPIQRWTLRRIALSAAILGGGAVAVVTTFQHLGSVGFTP